VIFSCRESCFLCLHSSSSSSSFVLSFETMRGTFLLQYAERESAVEGVSREKNGATGGGSLLSDRDVESILKFT
jgi:hypothetical protein